MKEFNDMISANYKNILNFVYKYYPNIPNKEDVIQDCCLYFIENSRYFLFLTDSNIFFLSFPFLIFIFK